MQEYQHEYRHMNRDEGSLLSFFQRNRLATITGLIGALAVTAIFSNAVFGQQSRHPSPLFATRGLKAPQPLPSHLRTAKLNIDQVKSALADEGDNNSKELMREVQSALSARGYYGGKIDGIYGSRTKAAIMEFQRSSGLETTGVASIRLLSEVLTSSSSKRIEVPVPKKIVRYEKPDPIAEQLKIESADNGLVARIQAGLRNYGYDDIKVDGKPGRQTRTAIQRFQLDYGMKITGEPTERVLKKLKEIGAYKQG